MAALSGPQFQQLHRALLSAFPTRGELSRLVLFTLDERLDAIVSPGNLSDAVLELITWASSRGKLQELIDGARRANPGNPDLQAFVEQSQPAATSIVEDLRRRSLERDMASLLEEYEAVNKQRLSTLDPDAALRLQRKADDLLQQMKQLEARLGSLPGETPPSGVAETPPTPRTEAQDTRTLRELMASAFSDSELSTLAFDYFPEVYEDFSSGHTKSQKIQLLIEYAARRGRQKELIEVVRRLNPYQYRRYFE